MTYNDDVIIKYRYPQQATRQLVPHDERWVDVFAVRNSVDPRLRFSNRHSNRRALCLKLAFCLGDSISVARCYVALAHALTVPTCMFTMSSSVKPVV